MVYKSKYMETYLKDMWDSIKNLSKILKDNNINFTFIGAAARNQYGHTRTTEDLDILVAKEDKEKMLNLPIGYIKDISNGRGKRFKLHEPKTDIDVIYSGEISGDGINGLKFLSPEKISHIIKGESFLTLKFLILYKLSSGINGKGRC